MICWARSWRWRVSGCTQGRQGVGIGTTHAMPEVWREVWSPHGVKVLGTPVGTPEFVEDVTQRRLDEENRLWEAIPSVPDLQCAWQILLQCAGPRCHHLLRTLPPSVSASCATGHDAGMQRTMEALLGGLPGDPIQKRVAHTISSLPMRMGGLGLRSASRMAQSAFWASWADAMPMISERLPEVANRVELQLAMEEPVGSLGELQEAAQSFYRCGFVARPSWVALRGGARPPLCLNSEPGEWQHGWQFHASSISEHHFRETMVLRPSPFAFTFRSRFQRRAHGGAQWTRVRRLPTALPHLGVGAASPPVEARCECGAPLDTLGRHRAVCNRSGRLRTRACPTERSLARVCREAGATVRFNTMLRDMNINVSADDHRSIEVLASGLPLHHGAQIAVDITLRCALRSCGNAHVHAAVMNGVVLARAREEKERESTSNSWTPIVADWLLSPSRLGVVGATKLWLSWTHLPPPAPGKHQQC